MADGWPGAKQERRHAQSPEGAPSREETAVLREVLRAVRRIRHGHVQIIIQDSRVVQIDQTEKVRLEQAGEGRPTR